MSSSVTVIKKYGRVFSFGIRTEPAKSTLEVIRTKSTISRLVAFLKTRERERERERERKERGSHVVKEEGGSCESCHVRDVCIFREQDRERERERDVHKD